LVSRYLVLVILNTPLVIAGILNAIVSYKLKHTSRRRCAIKVLLWLGIFAGLVFTKSIYSFLFSNHLTQTEPLSLFDVVQITGILLTLFIASQAHTKVDLLERRVQDLHQELSIRLSSKDKS
jgi:hypothetical protein